MAGVWILKGEVVQRGLTREAEMSKQSKGSVATHSQCYRGPKAEGILCMWLLTAKATVGHPVCVYSQPVLPWAKGRGHPVCGYSQPRLLWVILCVATHSQCYCGPSCVCGYSQPMLLWAKGRGHPVRVSRTPADSPTGAWPLEGTVTVNLCLPITSSQCDPAVSMQSSGSSSKETPPGAGFQRRPWGKTMPRQFCTWKKSQRSFHLNKDRG